MVVGETHHFRKPPCEMGFHILGATETTTAFAEDRIREFIAVGVLRGSMQGWKGWKIFVRKSRENFPEEIAIMDKLRRFGMIFSPRLHVAMVATIESLEMFHQSKSIHGEAKSCASWVLLAWVRPPLENPLLRRGPMAWSKKTAT